MISAWWLVPVVFVTFGFGVLVTALCAVAKQDELLEAWQAERESRELAEALLHQTMQPGDGDCQQEDDAVRVAFAAQWGTDMKAAER